MVLTGYNTDIEYGGVTYHVQTEDKGRENPVIETMVYAKGEILFSRKTPYDELIAGGADLKAVASLMDRQHRTLVETIRRGRLELLLQKKHPLDETDETAISHEREPLLTEKRAEDTKTLDEVILEYLQAQKQQAHLVLRSQGSDEFVYGQVTDIRILALNSVDQAPVPDVEVSVLFKSTEQPRRLILAEGVTNDRGIFEAHASIPPFNGGTSAVVVTGQSPLGQSEIKHLVHR